jgi:hypothetical protein
MPQLVRRLALAGDFADADWTNPANPVPDNARPFRVVAQQIQFEIVGRDGTGDGAIEVDVAGLTVDAWVGYEGELRDPSNPSAGKTIRRGLSIVEATASTISGRVRLLATDCELGGVGRLNLALTNVGALAAVHVRIVSGARPL